METKVKKTRGNCEWRWVG